jgi:hypothetical protein
VSALCFCRCCEWPEEGQGGGGPGALESKPLLFLRERERRRWRRGVERTARRRGTSTPNAFAAHFPPLRAQTPRYSVNYVHRYIDCAFLGQESPSLADARRNFFTSRKPTLLPPHEAAAAASRRLYKTRGALPPRAFRASEATHTAATTNCLAYATHKAHNTHTHTTRARIKKVRASLCLVVVWSSGPPPSVRVFSPARVPFRALCCPPPPAA